MEAKLSVFTGIDTEKVRLLPPTGPDITSVDVPDKQPLAAAPHIAVLTTEKLPLNFSLNSPAESTTAFLRAETPQRT